MKRGSLVLLGLLLAGCAQPQPAASSSPAATPSAAASATAVETPSPTPSPSPDLPLTSTDLSCTLPVVTQSGGGAGITMQGGFITFPSAELTDDPSGTMQSRYMQGGFVTTTRPALTGSGGYPFFDRALSRWVPVPPRQAVADGTAYAYVETDFQTNSSKAHIVDVRSGTERTFNLPVPVSPLVADFGPAGVYLLSAGGIGGPMAGVWLMDPSSGAVKQIRDLQQVWEVRDGYAWVGRFDPRDKTAWPPMEIARSNSLVRIDLATGAETTWFYQPGRYPWMIGFASGARPVVIWGGPQGNEARLIDQPGSSGLLIYVGNLGLDNPQPDGDRIWFGGQNGIYLYSPGHGFQKVYALNADPTTAPGIQPAGFCL